MPSSSVRSCLGSPVLKPTSQIAAVQGGRLLSASICVFSMKIVSVRIQFQLRMVRSSSSALPTELKSGWVLVANGVFVHCCNCSSNIAAHVCSAAKLLGNGLPSNGQVCPSPQKPYIIVSTNSTCG